MHTVVTRLLFHEVNQADRTAEGEEAPSYMFGKGPYFFGQIAGVVIHPHAFPHAPICCLRPETKV